jgi:hypothetical protein
MCGNSMLRETYRNIGKRIRGNGNMKTPIRNIGDGHNVRNRWFHKKTYMKKTGDIYFLIEKIDYREKQGNAGNSFSTLWCVNVR